MPTDPETPDRNGGQDLEAVYRRRISEALSQLPGGPSALPYHISMLNQEAIVRLLVEAGITTKLDFLKTAAEVAESTARLSRQQGRIVVPEPHRFRG